MAEVRNKGTVSHVFAGHVGDAIEGLVQRSDGAFLSGPASSSASGAPAAAEVLQENEELRMGLIEAKLSLAEADTEGHQLKRMLSKAVQKQIKLAEALTAMEAKLYKATGTFK